MDDTTPHPPPERVVDRVEQHAWEEAVACLDAVHEAPAEDRKETVRRLRTLAEDHPEQVEPLCATLPSFLDDDERSVRLTTAKLFVALARSEPEVTLPAVDALSDHLADDDEFYYVRARCAEALGYVAVESPEDVTDPDTLADLRIGLEFDEPEVKEKLAKALTYVALGDPSRLRHQVSSLAEYLDDETELVRYHLCTALVVVGCEHPAKLADATEQLQERLSDANPYVQGRAAEALGLLAASEVGTEVAPALDGVVDDEPPAFLTDRLAFCRRQLGPEQSMDVPEGVGTIQSIREETDDVVDEMTTPTEGVCPHCGLELPESGPPMCPRCGTPR
jgi:HEAT repeat protein